MKRFNVRIYGLLVHEGQVLISDEKYAQRAFTKFPGGGLEWGEGSIDCLKREFLEEFNLAVEVKDLFYFTDFFQQSAFSEHDQVLSVYYRIEADLKEIHSLINNRALFEQQLRFVELNEMYLDHLTFPIDKRVFEKLLRNLV